MIAPTGTDGPDAALVARQLGRVPRPPWRVAVRCRRGRPQVIASPSRLDEGSPFPTLYWLTCPHVRSACSAEESAGGAARMAAFLAGDAAAAARMLAADAEYARRRRTESGGRDACPGVGTAGQRDPLATKCLHAHAAAALAGIDDPVGSGMLAECGSECEADECARLADGSCDGSADPA